MQDIQKPSGHTALLVIDMQNGFFEDPALAAQRENLVRSCNELVRSALFLGEPVYNIRTVHQRSKSTWTLNMLDDDQGFLLEGSEQAKNLDDLEIQEATEVIKLRDSAFWQTDLRERLARDGVESVVIAGVSSHTCIASTAADAYAANLRVWLASDAIASADSDLAATTLELLNKEYRQKLVSTATLLSARKPLDSRHDHDKDAGFPI